MKRIASLLLGIILFLSVFPLSALADSKEYDIKELGLTISLPDDYDGYTRDVAANDPTLAILGINRQEALEEMEKFDLYLTSYFFDLSTFFDVSVSENYGIDFDSFSEEELCDYFSHVYSSSNKSELLSAPTIYNHSQRNFVKCLYSLSGEFFSWKYYIPRGKTCITFTLWGSDEDIVSSQEAVADSIIDSVHFYSKEPVPASPAPEATPFFDLDSYPVYYSGSEDEITFSLPSGWEKAEVSENAEWANVKYVHKENPEAFLQYGSMDFVDRLREMDSSLSENQLFLLDDTFLKDQVLAGLEELGPVEIQEYGLIKTDFCRFTVEKGASAGVTYLAHLGRGRLYLFQFSKDAASAYSADITSMLSDMMIFEPFPSLQPLATAFPNASLPPKSASSIPDEAAVPSSSGNDSFWFQVILFGGIGMILLALLIVFLILRKQKKQSSPPITAPASPQPVTSPQAVQAPAGYYFETSSEFVAYTRLFGETTTWLSGTAYKDEVNRGCRLFEQGQIQEAVEALQQALLLNPIGLSARFELCEIYIRCQDFAAAKQILLSMKEYLSEPESIAKFYRRFGYIKTEEQQLKLAVACYRYSESFASHPSVQQELSYLRAQPGYLAEWALIPPEPVLAESEIPLMKKPDA